MLLHRKNWLWRQQPTLHHSPASNLQNHVQRQNRTDKKVLPRIFPVLEVEHEKRSCKKAKGISERLHFNKGRIDGHGR